MTTNDNSNGDAKLPSDEEIAPMKHVETEKLHLFVRMLQAALDDANRDATFRYLNACGTELNRLSQIAGEMK